MTDCKHRQIRAWAFADDGEAAGMWFCAECRHRFVPLDIAQEDDAKRYRWLRAQGWWNGPMCVVVNPKNAVKLGHNTLSMDDLDAAIDAAMEERAHG